MVLGITTVDEDEFTDSFRSKVHTPVLLSSHVLENGGSARWLELFWSC